MDKRPSESSPRLMIRCDKPLSDHAMERLSALIGRVNDGEDARCLVVEPGIDVYQFIGGRWPPVFVGQSPMPEGLIGAAGVEPSGVVYLARRSLDQARTSNLVP